MNPHSVKGNHQSPGHAHGDERHRCDHRLLGDCPGKERQNEVERHLNAERPERTIDVQVRGGGGEIVLRKREIGRYLLEALQAEDLVMDRKKEEEQQNTDVVGRGTSKKPTNVELESGLVSSVHPEVVGQQVAGQQEEEVDAPGAEAFHNAEPKLG